MTQERQHYFHDESDDNTKGIVILETDSDTLRVTENRDGNWCKPFWMPEGEFEALDTTHVGKLDSDQFLSVCEASDAIPAQA